MQLIRIILIFFALIFSPVFAQAPDYFNPYAKFSTDKEEYSWTDKVRIKIVAPSWNSNKYLIDIIGNTNDHPIKISTKDKSLKPYTLTETDPSSGVFVGEVTLTGFLHDADGDGEVDTLPRTLGTGPTDGFLVSSNDDAITITWTFADDVTLTHSVPITWNIGQIRFDQTNFLLDQLGKVAVYDPDLNLDPEVKDQIPITVSSDSDTAGISITATETTIESGLFEGTFAFTTSKASSGNRLYVIPGNSIYAKYDDYTLPRPYSTNSNLEIKTISKVLSDVPPLERLTISESYLADRSGNIVYDPVINEQVQLVTKVQNIQDFGQPFVYIVQVKDVTGTVILLSWIQGELFPFQELELSKSWTPTISGEFTVEAFVWDSLSNPVPLSSKTSNLYFIQ